MKKSTLVILAVFIVLAGLAFVFLKKPAERGITRLSLPKFEVKDVDTLTVAGPMAIELKKSGEVWTLADGREADQSAVTRAVEGAAKLQSSDLLARGSEHYAAYEVDDAKGAHVTFKKDGKAVSDFIVGKSVSGGTAVRVGDDVYAAKGVSAGLYAKPATSWLERKLFSQNIGDATKLEVRIAGEEAYALVKENEAWTFEGGVPAGFKLDSGVAAGLVAQVVNLRAKDVLATASAVTAAGAEDVFVITWKEGASTLHIPRVPADADNLHAAIDGKPRAFVLSEGTVSPVRKRKLDLRDASLMSFDNTKAVGLTIADGANKTVFAKRKGVWELVSTTEKKPEGWTLDPQAVERRVTQLANAKGMRIADQAADNGLAASKTKVTVKLEGGKEETLAFGTQTKDENRDVVYARGNTGNVVIATPYVRTNLAGGVSSFAKRAASDDNDALSKLDPNALQGLPPEVRAGLMKQIEQKRREQEMLKQIQAK
ncbi:MAG: DUF4340 domain-containing protein [Myxococcota bacterium]|nr:DUF4340 domain-containing protein [Myxococcota bacterium]